MHIEIDHLESSFLPSNDLFHQQISSKINETNLQRKSYQNNNLNCKKELDCQSDL